MTTEATNEVSQNGQISRGPGELIWAEGQEVKPLRIQQGVVAYRRGNIAIGLIGPGQIAVPVPGIGVPGAAAAELVAITETTATVVNGGQEISTSELEPSSRAVLTGADRLGNMFLPQRLAALLLDITELTGQPVVSCRQDILAMAAAARRETVATILSSWRDEDWIQTRYRRTKVLDRAALERIRDFRS
jgi:hypothetical protein